MVMMCPRYSIAFQSFSRSEVVSSRLINSRVFRNQISVQQSKFLHNKTSIQPDDTTSTSNRSKIPLTETLKQSVRSKDSIKLRKQLKKESAKYGMTAPRPTKPFVSFLDKLPPTTIKESLGLEDPAFIQLVKKINFDNRCEDVIIQLIREKVYHILLIENFIQSFPKEKIKEQDFANRMIGFDKLQTRKEFKDVMRLKAEEYPGYFHNSSQNVINIPVLKRSLKVSWITRLKIAGKSLFGIGK